MTKKIMAFVLLFCTISCSVETQAAYVYKPLTQNSGIVIDFGEKLEKQEREGYKKLQGENTWQKFLNLRSELPEEVPVIEHFEPVGKNIYFVATDGDDKNDGSIESPFATVNKALQVIKQLSPGKKANGSIIYIRGGLYKMTEQIEIDSSMCDMKNNAGLFITAYNGEDVTFAESAYTDSANFQKVTPENTAEETYNRFNKDVVDNIYYADIDKFGIDSLQSLFVDAKSGGIPELYLGSDKMMLARYPNGGETYIESVVYTPSAQGTDYSKPIEFVPEDKTVFTWGEITPLSIRHQVCVSWYMGESVVKRDFNKQTVFGFNMASNWLPVNTVLNNHKAVRSHFYYRNVPEALDMETEWCVLETENEKRIYFYPVEGKIKQDLRFSVSAANNDALFSINGGNAVVLDGINMSFCKTGVLVDNSTNVVVQRCSITNASQWCVNIKDSYKCGVLTSDLLDSASGVRLENTDISNYDLKPNRNFVQDCVIKRMTTYAYNNQWQCGSIISHNLMSEAYSGGAFNGPENIFEYNECEQTVMQGSEGATVYIGGSLITPNNMVRYNYLHDNDPPVSDTHFYAGFSGQDDMGEWNFWYSNIFENGLLSVANHSGDHHVVYDNVSLNTGGVKNSDNYGLAFSNYSRILMLSDKTRQSITREYYDSTYNSPQWSERYDFIKKEVDYYNDLSKRYEAGDADWDGEEMKFGRAATGEYYLNNILVDTPECTPATLGKEYLITDVDVVENPDAEIPKLYTSDYNVIHGNETRTSFDITTLPYYSKIGPITEREPDSDENKIRILTPLSPDNAISGQKFEVSWMKNRMCNSYCVQVAKDTAFEQIIGQTLSFEGNASILIEKDGTYYYRVLGFDLDSDDKTKPIIQSETYMFDFISDYVPYFDDVIKYGAVTIDGEMDDIYNTSPVFNINPEFGGNLKQGKKTNTGELRFAWDLNYFYVYAKVNDSLVQSAGYEYMMGLDNPWANDCLEMYLAEKKISVDAFGMRCYTHQNQFTKNLLDSLPYETILTKNGMAYKKTSTLDKSSIPADYTEEGADGYIVEMALPLSKLVEDVSNGAIVSIRIQNNDYNSLNLAGYSFSDTYYFMLEGADEIGDASEKFTDISETAWYATAVKELYKKRLIRGTSDNTFAPDEIMSRAMFISMLSRYNAEVTQGENDTAWYTPHINWAKDNGILKAVYEDGFDPDIPITREEMAQILYNYNLYLDCYMISPTSLEFSDDSSIDEKFMTAVKTMYAANIINGDDKQCVNPKASGTRAEACQMLYRFIKYILRGDTGWTYNGT